MNEADFLIWVRGPGLNIAVAIFLLGLILRLVEVFALGRKPDLSVPRQHVPGASGWHTILRRSLSPYGMLKHGRVTYIAGYTFHFGLALIVFFGTAHIQFIEGVFGISWPALPPGVIDLTTVITLAALLVMLVDRLSHRVKRLLSNFDDHFSWAVTFLPVLTGWLAVKHLLLPYTAMLALHILSVELLLAVLPFTKLIHAFTLFGARWYNGQVNARKGVPV